MGAETRSARRGRWEDAQQIKNAYPRNSRNRHITFATSSSFLSSGSGLAPGLTLVRAADFSVAVAPRHSAKSIVDDCQGGPF